jgi:hypothetical protein
VELVIDYLANVVDPVSLVLDPIKETPPDKIRKYRTDYNNNPSNDISFMPDLLIVWEDT